MNFIPQRRGRRLNRPAQRRLLNPDVIVSRSHLQWVRGHRCLCFERAGHVCEGKIEAHHSKPQGSGGGDETAVPLCSKAHTDGHSGGWKTFEAKYGLKLREIAADLWKLSPHRRVWELKRGDENGQ